MKNTLYFAFIILLLACKQRHSVADVITTDIAIHLNATNKQQPGELSYRLQLVPAKKLAEQQNEKSTNELWYRMDSLLSISTRSGQRYPVIATRIANGSRSVYEYLIVFLKEGLVLPDTLKMICTDKFFTHKVYPVNLYQQ